MDGLTQDQLQQFHNRGYLICPNFLPPPVLQSLRENCDHTLSESLKGLPVGYNAFKAIANRFGCVFEPVASKFLQASSQEYSTTNINVLWKQIRDLAPGGREIVNTLLSDLFAKPVSQLLQSNMSNLHLFNEQFIVKPPTGDELSSFAYHQDGSYLGEDWNKHSYISLWVPLDHVTEENGCLRFIPFPTNADVTRFADHYKASQLYQFSTDELNDLLTQDFEMIQELEESAPITAGSAIFISPFVFHRSGPNYSNAVRRAWMPQFSDGVIRNVSSADSLSVALAIPLRE